MLDQATKSRLDSIEENLCDDIKRGEFPFLGHYSNSTYNMLKLVIVPELRKSHSRLQFFLKLMRKWPATFATYLDHYVAEGYGAKGTIEVYPFIEEALNQTLTFGEKEDLWKGFRSACLRLGLSVSSRKSGNSYMVREYLRQAGVPLHYMEQLVHKMVGHANSVGLPDDDDPCFY